MWIVNTDSLWCSGCSCNCIVHKYEMWHASWCRTVGWQSVIYVYNFIYIYIHFIIIITLNVVSVQAHSRDLYLAGLSPPLPILPFLSLPFPSCSLPLVQLRDLGMLCKLSQQSLANKWCGFFCKFWQIFSLKWNIWQWHIYYFKVSGFNSNL